MTDLLTEPQTNDKCRVLIVDDDQDFAESLADILHSHGYPCAVATAAEDACSVDEHFGAQIALVDLCLGPESGLDLLGDLKEARPDMLCIMMSAYADLESAMTAVREGVFAYLQKPVDPGELLETLGDCGDTLQFRRQKAAVDRALVEGHTQLERRNRRLAELRENAERFVDDVSHEFRTPLAVVKEFTSILAEGLGGPVTAEQADYLGRIAGAAEDLTQMVDDLLDSSRLESSLRRVRRRRCKVTGIVQTVRRTLSRSAETRNIRIAEDLPAKISDVFADEEKVRRTLVNLVVNALKFSPSGSEVTIWAREGMQGIVEIGVTDQGRGMSPEELKVIFERFRRVGNTTGLSTRGFGLGLHIAKELVWLNLGRIHAESTPGRGSTFSFTLPICSRKPILESYFAQLSPPTQETAVSAIAVTIDGNRHALERTRDYLVSECRPMDLILSDRKNHRLIVLGWTDLPEDWARRLQERREKSVGDDAALRVPTMEITTIGTWLSPPESEEAMKTVLALLSGRAALGQEDRRP